MRLCRGKRPRGARPSQVVVALFLPLKSLYCGNGTARLSLVSII